MKQNVTYIEVSRINTDEDGNPRKIGKKNYERLKKSIKANKDFFEARPVLLNDTGEERMQVIGGHQRLKAAIEIGMEKVPCFVFDHLDEETAKRYTILDNANEGAWDYAKLQEFSADLDLDEFNVSIPETVDYAKVVAQDVLSAIIYQPSETPATVDEFFDNEEYDKVKTEIAKMQIPSELKEFVEIRLNSFRRFRFDKIADYYARADEPTRLLMRQLALVFDVSGTSFERDLFDFYDVGLKTPEIYE